MTIFLPGLTPPQYISQKETIDTKYMKKLLFVIACTRKMTEFAMDFIFVM